MKTSLEILDDVYYHLNHRKETDAFQVYYNLLLLKKRLEKEANGSGSTTPSIDKKSD